MRLLGRLPELTACQEALSANRRGATAAVITGPPGIGKTTLWLAAIADCQPPGAVVLRTTGIPGEQAPLANVADLLDPVADTISSLLPGPQASAVRAALGLAPPQTPVTDMLLERAMVGLLRGLAQRASSLRSMTSSGWTGTRGGCLRRPLCG